MILTSHFVRQLEEVGRVVHFWVIDIGPWSFGLLFSSRAGKESDK
jgi:hypothetical protein